MIRENVYQKNLRIILEAIKGKGIKTAERMIREEIEMSKAIEEREKKERKK